MKMKFNYSIIAICFFLGINSAVHAGILAGGPIFGGPQQTEAVCYIYNAGTGSVQITSKRIQKEPNTALALNLDWCSNTLAAGAICGVSTNVANNSAHTCKIVVSPSGADVRGSLELRDSTGNVLTNVELR